MHKLREKLLTLLYCDSVDKSLILAHEIFELIVSVGNSDSLNTAVITGHPIIDSAIKILASDQRKFIHVLNEIENDHNTHALATILKHVYCGVDELVCDILTRFINDNDLISLYMTVSNALIKRNLITALEDRCIVCNINSDFSKIAFGRIPNRFFIDIPVCKRCTNIYGYSGVLLYLIEHYRQYRRSYETIAILLSMNDILKNDTLKPS